MRCFYSRSPSFFFSKKLIKGLSFLTESSPKLTYLEKLTKKYSGKKFDVGVIGKTYIGVAVAMEASKRGLKVALVTNNIKGNY